MKTKFTVEFADKKVDKDELEEKITRIWTDAGNEASDIKSLQVFLQPDNSIAYFVINDDFKGDYKF